ncbi:hypothetical protein T01_1561 [Trichinella spiralis]|uniref:Uncharacterized protein n=1 Tax=Trichinella spiralis TaxID=6334 RepID=A0A0V1BZ67_TRISP|nr:hypothetical protein T01_1561 [Trichinella spiralis]
MEKILKKLETVPSLILAEDCWTVWMDGDDKRSGCRLSSYIVGGNRVDSQSFMAVIDWRVTGAAVNKQASKQASMQASKLASRLACKPHHTVVKRCDGDWPEVRLLTKRSSRSQFCCCFLITSQFGRKRLAAAAARFLQTKQYQPTNQPSRQAKASEHLSETSLHNRHANNAIRHRRTKQSIFCFFSLYASSIDYRWNPALPGSTAERQQLCPVASASSRSAAFRSSIARAIEEEEEEEEEEAIVAAMGKSNQAQTDRQIGTSKQASKQPARLASYSYIAIASLCQ